MATTHCIAILLTTSLDNSYLMHFSNVICLSLLHIMIYEKTKPDPYGNMLLKSN